MLARCRRRALCRCQVRFQSLTDKSVLEPEPELFIHLQPDKTNNTLTIRDSGVGMTKADLVNNLGAYHPRCAEAESMCRQAEAMYIS